MSDFEVCPCGTLQRLAEAELRADRAEQCAQTEAARADHAEAESRRLSDVVSLVNRRSDHLGIRLREVIAERDALRMDVDALRAERDEDRRREYGYSQQTVDAITNERDALLASCETYSEWADQTVCTEPELRAIRQQMRSAIALVKKGGSNG